MTGPAKGKVAEQSDSKGSLIRYTYDHLKQKTREHQVNRNEQLLYSYTPVDSADPLLLTDVRPRTIIRKINDIEVERTYYAYTTNHQEIVERVLTQGTPYGTEGNLRTITTWYPVQSNTVSAGRIASVRHEDG